MCASKYQSVKFRSLWNVVFRAFRKLPRWSFSKNAKEIFPGVPESLELLPISVLALAELRIWQKAISAISLKFSFRNVSVFHCFLDISCVTKKSASATITSNVIVSPVSFAFYRRTLVSTRFVKVRVMQDQISREIDYKGKKISRVLRYFLPPYVQKCQKTREIIRIYVFLILFYFILFFF
jgi:hypothetical protein